MPSPRALLPRSAPAAAGVSAAAVHALLDRLDAASIESHSIMVVRGGHVVAEGWWAPYSAGRPHLLYSLTKSFTAVAVGLVIADGLLSLDDRVVDVLPDRVPAGVSDQGRRLTVHHLLSMTAGHREDSLTEAWRLEPGDLAKGFLRVPFPDAEGTRHAYDNATTYVLARMVERVTGRSLPELLGERLFQPMGVEHAEWDRLADGAAFGFHGLHLTTEAVAAFGELLLRDGRWGDRQLVPADWVRLATMRHVDTRPVDGDPGNPDFLLGYGYQFWRWRHGFHGHGSFGQQCLVASSYDLVVALTGAVTDAQVVFDAIVECLLPGLDRADSAADDEILAERLRRLSLAPVPGPAAREQPAEAVISAPAPQSPVPGTSAGADAGNSAPQRTVTATVGAVAGDSPLPGGEPVVVDPVDGGWMVRLGPDVTVAAGHGEWRESSPLGRPVVAAGAWQGGTFVADLYVVTTPHRVRLVVDADAGTAVATWNIVPLTTPDLALHLRAPLMTRPDVA
jgi:CubicO group peptidase (beta-lactamase class C family)